MHVDTSRSHQRARRDGLHSGRRQSIYIYTEAGLIAFGGLISVFLEGVSLPAVRERSQSDALAPDGPAGCFSTLDDHCENAAGLLYNSSSICTFSIIYRPHSFLSLSDNLLIFLQIPKNCRQI